MTISIDVYETDRKFSVFINNDSSGYRICGPKLMGQGKLVSHNVLTENDVDEIRSYLTYFKRELKRIRESNTKK